MPTVHGFNIRRAIAPGVLQTFGITSSGIANGPFAANSFDNADMVNGAGTNQFATSTGGAKVLLYITDYRQPVAESIASSQDQEVDFFCDAGVVLLRHTADGRGIYMKFQRSNNGALSSFQIGIFKADPTRELQDYAIPTAGSYAILYKSPTSLFTLIPNYDNNIGPGSNNYFTFGVQGMDIYVKFNSVEFLRLFSFDHITPGKVTVKNAQNIINGFQLITVRLLPTKPFSSNSITKVLDFRDLVKNCVFTGSWNQGANQITVSKLPLAKAMFAVGDQLIVPAPYGKGLIGPGGTWPSLSYSSVAAMNADLSKPDTTACYVQGTINGRLNPTYYFNKADNTWYTLFGQAKWFVGGAEPPANYWFDQCLPKPARPTITAIAWNADGSATLTVDMTAQATLTGVTMYTDNSDVFNVVGATTHYNRSYYKKYISSADYRDLFALDRSGWTFIIPSGDTYIGDSWYFDGPYTNLHIKASGNKWFNLVSPKGGTPPAGFIASAGSCHGLRVQGGKLTGNNYPDSWGLHWWKYDPTITPTSQIISDALSRKYGVLGQDAGYLPLDTLHNCGWNFIVCDNVTLLDFGADGMYTSEATNASSQNFRRYRGRFTRFGPTWFYLNWGINDVSFAKGSYAKDCIVDSSGFNMCGGFQSFQTGVGSTFEDCTGYNAVFSLNATTNVTLIRCKVNMNRNTVGGFVNTIGNNGFIFSVNTPPRSGSGGCMVDCEYHATDYQDAFNNIFPAVSIADNWDYVYIKNLTVSAPDAVHGTLTNGGAAVVSSSIHPHLWIDGITTNNNKMDLLNDFSWQHNSNVWVLHGEVHNVTADRVAVGSTVITSNITSPNGVLIIPGT